MRDVLRRIAIHGGMTAFVLAIVGFMFAELATIWLAGSPGVRTATGEPVAATETNDEVGARLRSRVPLLMAAWGFAFVAVGELVLHGWRGRRKPPAKPAEPDPAEKLLEELLSQVESRAANPDGAVDPEVRAAHNSPVPNPTHPPGERGA